MVTLINDWFHVRRKTTTNGDFAKRWHDANAHSGLIVYMLKNLRNSPTRPAFEALAKTTVEVLTFLGEGDFAAYFSKVYLTPPWDGWFTGATPAGVGYSGQQGIESGHSKQKALITKMELRATPTTFFKKSLPIILAAAARILKKHPVELISHQGKGPITATFIAEAEIMCGTKPCTFELSSDGKTRFFVVNNKTERRKMTSARALAHGRWYDDGVLPKSSTPDKDFYKKLYKDVLNASMVSEPASCEPPLRGLRRGKLLNARGPPQNPTRLGGCIRSSPSRTAPPGASRRARCTRRTLEASSGTRSAAATSSTTATTAACTLSSSAASSGSSTSRR
jgi:hypothetical protein